MLMTKRTLHRLTKLIVEVVLMAQPFVLLTACQQTDELNQPEPRTQVPLQLTSGISASVTRAYNTTWETNDQIGVFTTAATTTTITTSGDQLNSNIPYVITTGAETWVNNTSSYKSFAAVDKNIYLPADGSNVDVYGYYPYASTVSSTVPLNITIPTAQNDANQQTNLHNCDVLTARTLSATTPVNVDNTTAQLLFHHVLSKVLIKLKLGIGVNLSDIQNKVSSVVISGQPTVGTFAPLTQTLAISTTTGTNQTITAKTLTSGDPDYEDYVPGGTIHSYCALVMPNDNITNPTSSSVDVTGANANPHILTFIVGDGNITYNYPITYALRSGYQTTFTITFGALGIKVDAAIQPWSTDGTTGIIAPEDPYPDE